jgi:hypothetical protein
VNLITSHAPAELVSPWAVAPHEGHRFAPGYVPSLVGSEDPINGYNQGSDVLAVRTTDGVDYNELWAEFQETIRIQNAERQLIIQYLSFPVTSLTESVTQLSSSRFERATEFGEPRGVRQKPKAFFLGYDFDWYDIAARFTWRYLLDATSAQVEAIHASVLDADNQLVFTKVLEALYNNENRTADIEDQEVNVYALYNGDGTTPPRYKTNTFDGTHNHYLVSGAAAITPGDLDDLYEHLRHHGYGAENGVNQVVAVNSREGKVIRGFRITNGATYDFIPAAGEPTDRLLEPGQVIFGNQPSSTFRGLNVIGKYGHQLIVEDDLFPAGYVVVIGTGGPENLNNPVGIRQHPAAPGLRLVKGRDADYPLTDSFYQRGIGTGIRQRGGAAVMQIKASGTYTPPSEYLPE